MSKKDQSKNVSIKEISLKEKPALLASSSEIKSYLNVLNPQGAWNALISYTTKVVYGGVANTMLYVACPLITYSSHVYYCDNTNGQPTLGTTPDTDTAWTLLI